MKIRTKLGLVFLAVVLLPLIGGQYVGSVVIDRQLEDSILEGLNVVADLKVDKLESFFAERIADMRTAQDYENIKKNFPIVIEYADNRSSVEYQEAKHQLDSQLATFQRVHGYSSVELVAPSGKVVYTSNDEHNLRDLDNSLLDPGDQAFIRGQQALFLSNVFRNPADDGFSMFVTAPSVDNFGNFIGVIVFEMNMDPIYDFIQDTTGLGQTGETLVGIKIAGDEAGVIAGHTMASADYALFLNPLRHDKHAALQRLVSFDDEFAFPIQEATGGGSGSGLSVDYRSEPILAAWRYVPSLDWGLVAKIDTKEAFQPISDLRRMSIIVGGISLIFVLLLALYLSRVLTAPIIHLTKAATDVASGKMDVIYEGIQRKDEIGDLSNAFMSMTRAIARKEKEKYEFITSASHQLRTPITEINFQITAIQDLMKGKRGTKEYFDILDNISDSSEEAALIMGDLLKTLELKGGFSYKKTKLILLKPLLNSILESYSEKIEAKGLKVEIVCQQKCRVKVDESRFKYVLLNLIDNAITYSHDKGIIKILAKPYNNGVYFEISDNGIGIPKKQQIRVFEQFFRAKNAYEKKTVGTGLGLYIVKMIIDDRGGKINFKSEKNKGTKFYFWIPD